MWFAISSPDATMNRFALLGVSVPALFTMPLHAAAPTSQHIAYFEQHVRPLLVKHCYECHSTSSKILQGGLLLDSRPGWQKGGDSGAVVVPGKPDESLLVRAVRYDKDEF